MNFRFLAVTTLAFVFLSLQSSADTHYVDINSSNPVAPYTNWASAATNIQDAVNIATSGDTVLVTNGHYYLTSEIAISSDIRIESVNGPEVTIVDGQNSVRGFNLGATLSTLSGLTITNGNAGDWNGGGILCNSISPVITNCLITGNTARRGGGVSYGTVRNCIFIGNGASDNGGGMAYGEVYDSRFEGNTAGRNGGATSWSDLNHCIVIDNSSANHGGGVQAGLAYDCLIVGNSAVNYGGGMRYSSARGCTIISNSAFYGGGVSIRSTDEVVHSIIWYNQAPVDADIYDTGATTYYTCSPSLTAGTNGNITNAPGFISKPGSFGLIYGSPCIDAGEQSWIVNTNDLAGLPRVINGEVDIGAYEYDALTTDSDEDLITDALELTNGLNPLVSNTGLDTDMDGLPDVDEVLLSGTDPLTNSVFNLVATAGTNGVIHPAGTNEVILGYSTNFLITADTYYHIATVQTNGIDLAGVTNLTSVNVAWSNVVADGTIEASFAANVTTNGIPEWWLASYGITNDFDAAVLEDPDGDFLTTGEEFALGYDPTVPDQFKLFADAVTNGVISPTGGVIVAKGGLTNFAIIPDLYYSIFDVQTNGQSVGAVTNFVWSNVRTGGIISATFDADLATNNVPHWWLAQFGYTNDFDAAALQDLDNDGLLNWQEFEENTSPTNDSTVEIVASAGANGTISPAGTNLVIIGRGVNFSFTPDPYYKIYGFWVNGSYRGNVSSYYWPNVSVDGTISVAFSALVTTNGVPHWWLANLGYTQPFNDVVNLDKDADGLSNSREYFLGTDGDNPHSDPDSLTDGDEVDLYGTNPLEEDTDGDGFDDGLEVANGLDPRFSNTAFRDNAADLGLYTSNAVIDLAVGDAVLHISNNTAVVELKIWQQDSNGWTNASDAVQWSQPINTNQQFFQIRAQP